MDVGPEIFGFPWVSLGGFVACQEIVNVSDPSLIFKVIHDIISCLSVFVHFYGY